ncbi:hypothetical protein J6590_076318 [Homalodisca vitripennis]|nr:hypothetical protein J6590_076318 [Homalodisca vitripennis]
MNGVYGRGARACACPAGETVTADCTVSVGWDMSAATPPPLQAETCIEMDITMPMNLRKKRQQRARGNKCKWNQFAVRWTQSNVGYPQGFFGLFPVGRIFQISVTSHFASPSLDNRVSHQWCHPLHLYLISGLWNDFYIFLSSVIERNPYSGSGSDLATSALQRGHFQEPLSEHLHHFTRTKLE